MGWWVVVGGLRGNQSLRRHEVRFAHVPSLSFCSTVRSLYLGSNSTPPIPPAPLHLIIRLRFLGYDFCEGNESHNSAKEIKVAKELQVRGNR